MNKGNYIQEQTPFFCRQAAYICTFVDDRKFRAQCHAQSTHDSYTEMVNIKLIVHLLKSTEY
jgi:hypothetical protein